MKLHPAAWIAWTAGGLVLVQSATDPLLLAVAIAAMIFTAVAAGGDRGPLKLMLVAAVVALAVRVALFALAGHPGGTIWFTTPSLRLPALLGGFRLGGAISGEVVAQSAVEGLRLAAVLVCFGVLMSVVEPIRIVRMVPRVLFEAGLVVAIAATFVPSLVRTARDVRDAQRMRGYRGRGPRALRAYAVPVLACTLDRAITIAESMESRGFGRRAPRRTRYRRDRIERADVAVVVAAACTAVAAIVLRSRLAYDAWPVVHVPRGSFAGVLLAATLAAPVVAASLSRARLLAVDARRPVRNAA